MGVINNTTKNFRIVGSLNWDSSTLLRFIKKYVHTGIQIVKDSWGGYNCFDSPDLGYQHKKFNHGLGLFEAGVQSTSQIEVIWNILKSKIKNSYCIIPGKNIFRYISEAENKYIIRVKHTIIN